MLKSWIHIKSPHIAVECHGMIVAKTLINNGSTLSFPCHDPSKSWVEETLIRLNSMMVRTFDGIKKVTPGEIDLKVLIGPCEFEISFVVVDIPAIFNSLLGLLWIHTAKGISSSLHEKIDFTAGKRLIYVIAEEGQMVPSSTLVPSIEAHLMDTSHIPHSSSYWSITYHKER